MSVPWSDWYAEIVSNIRTAWPDVKTTGGGGIHDINLMERMTQERIDAFPYAVVDLAAVPSGDWGLNNSAFEVRVEIHYIAKLGYGMPALRTKLDDLRHQMLRPSSFTLATCLDCTEMTLSTNHPAMEVFIRKNIAFIAGMCAFEFVIGETISD